MWKHLLLSVMSYPSVFLLSKHCLKRSDKQHALNRHPQNLCSLQVIMVLVVFGVGAIIGDGVLTPVGSASVMQHLVVPYLQDDCMCERMQAISVLSSIEGLHHVAEVSQGDNNIWSDIHQC